MLLDTYSEFPNASFMFLKLPKCIQVNGDDIFKMLILTIEFLHSVALLPKSYHMLVGITVTNQDMHVSSRNLGWPSFRKL